MTIKKLSRQQILDVVSRSSLSLTGKIRVKKYPGWVNQNYLISNGVQNIVLRIYEKPGNVALKEFFVIKTILDSQIDFPVPKILHIDTSKEILEYAFMFYENIPGRTLYSAYKNMTCEDLNILATVIGDYLARLHALDVSQNNNLISKMAQLIFVEKEFVKKNLFVALEKGLKNQIVSFPQASKIVRQFDRENIFNERVMSTLVHGDFHGENICVSKNVCWDITGFIDFECAFIGIPEWDFIRVLGLTPVENYILEETVIDGYSKCIDFDAKVFKRRLYWLKLIVDLDVVGSITNVDWESINQDWLPVRHRKRLFVALREYK